MTTPSSKWREEEKDAIIAVPRRSEDRCTRVHMYVGLPNSRGTTYLDLHVGTFQGTSSTRLSLERGSTYLEVGIPSTYMYEYSY